MHNNKPNNHALFLGIDGGGSTCRARLSNAQGKTLGEGKAGPSNLRLGIEPVKQQIILATKQALAEANLAHTPLKQLSAGMGLAGAVLESDQQLAQPIKDLFHTCKLHDDAYIACLGAHQGHAGGIIILGTGSCAQIITPTHNRTYGGWGFTISDHASGAHLGRAAIRLSLLALESIIPASPLTDHINQHFTQQAQHYLQWSTQATPQEYAQFAPDIFKYAEQQDPHARAIIAQAVTEVTQLIDVLDHYQTGRISLLGGLAKRYPQYLPHATNDKLCTPQGDALDGALFLAKNNQLHSSPIT